MDTRKSLKEELEEHVSRFKALLTSEVEKSPFKGFVEIHVCREYFVTLVSCTSDKHFDKLYKENIDCFEELDDIGLESWMEGRAILKSHGVDHRTFPF